MGMGKVGFDALYLHPIDYQPCQINIVDGKGTCLGDFLYLMWLFYLLSDRTYFFKS